MDFKDYLNSLDEKVTQKQITQYQKETLVKLWNKANATCEVRKPTVTRICNDLICSWENEDHYIEVDIMQSSVDWFYQSQDNKKVDGSIDEQNVFPDKLILYIVECFREE